MEYHNIYEGKTVLVTGATGLVGFNLVERLLGFDGIRVIAAGRSEEKLRMVFRRFLGLGHLRLLAFDVCQALPEAMGPVDFVFHAASPISGKTIREDPLSVISANLAGTENCLGYLVRQKEMSGRVGTMVLFSSATVYGAPGVSDRRCDESETVFAEALTSLTSPYSESKRMMEVLSLAYARQYGVSVRIVRFGYVYGPCPVLPNTAFYEFLKKAVAGEDIVFNNSGFARRDNIFVRDAVSGLLAVCEYGVPSEAYNLSSDGFGGNYAAIDEMASTLAKAAKMVDGREISVAVEAGQRRPGGLRLSNEKGRCLGWRPTTSLEDGVLQTYRVCRDLTSMG